MALPAGFPIFKPAPVQTGILVGIAPTDPNFAIELARAPDSGGSPGTPITIAQLPPAPLSGVHFVDRLPITGAKFFYRHRHVRDGWTPGAWGPWSRAATAKFLDGSNLAPANPISFDPIPTAADSTTSDESFGTDGIISFGPDGRQQLVFNGNAERGLRYWQSVSRTDPLSYPIPVQPAMALSLDTSTPYIGSASFKFVAAASTNGARILQTTRATDGDDESASPIRFRARVGDQFRVRFAAKASTGSTSVSILLKLYGVLLNEIGSFILANPTNVGTSWAVYDTISPPLVGSGTVTAAVALVATATDGRTIYVDDLSIEPAPTASAFAGTIAPATIDGWNQDNVVASQSNVELTRATGRWRAVQAGSVTGVVATMSEARTAGTLTVKVFKNTGLAGAAGSQLGTMTAVIDGTNTSRKATTQAKDVDAFAAGDELYLVVTTDSGWLPVTSDLRAALEVEV